MTLSSFNRHHHYYEHQSSHQMDKQFFNHTSGHHHQWATPHTMIADQEERRTEEGGSVLRSLLSKPPKLPQVDLPRSNRPRIKTPEEVERVEWTNRVNVPFDSHCRIRWTWTGERQNHHHDHVFVFNDTKTGNTRSIVFHPDCANGKFACFETFAAMGERPLRKNAFTYWEIEVSNRVMSNATSLMVGVGTKHAKMSSIGYLNLIGIDQFGWGLSNNGHIWHNNQQAAFCNPLWSLHEETSVIGLLFDGFKGQLTIYLNGASLGCAFTGLNGHELYPMISSTASASRFRMGPVFESMPTLQDLCRNTITTSLPRTAWNHGQLLPKPIIEFLHE